MNNKTKKINDENIIEISKYYRVSQERIKDMISTGVEKSLLCEALYNLSEANSKINLKNVILVINEMCDRARLYAIELKNIDNE